MLLNDCFKLRKTMFYIFVAAKGFTLKRFIKKLCDAFKVEIEIINHRDEQKYEEEITEDIIAIMTSYSARIYGKRGGRCKKL